MAVAMQPMVVQPVMMMPMVQAPGQQSMPEEKEFAYLDFNQMKSLMMNTKDGNYVMYEKNMDCGECAKAACMSCITCGGYDKREFTFQGPGHKLVVFKPSGCNTDWSVSLDTQGTVGGNRKAGCCAGGCMFCIAKYMMCWGTDKYFEMYHIDGNGKKNEKFTMRKKLFPCWCCADILCNMLAGMTGPCAEEGAKCMACCNFCNNTEYLTIKQPIYGPWGTGNEPIGHITKTERAVPFCCCQAVLEPVRASIQVPGNSEPGDVANLGFMALVYSKRIPVNFQTPKGNFCLDCGLSVDSQWSSFEDMVNLNSAASGASGTERK